MLTADLPNVKLADCNAIDLSLFDKCLVIAYTSEVEYAGLVQVDGFESVLEGSLITTAGQEKEGTRVSVTMKEGNMALVSCAIYKFYPLNVPNRLTTISSDRS